MKRVFLGAVAAALLSLGLAAPLHAADTIKIGIAGAHSGDLASYGVPSLNAAKVVVAKANAQGGVLGKQIELVIGDDQCKPELATNVATKGPQKYPKCPQRVPIVAMKVPMVSPKCLQGVPNVSPK